MKRYLLHFLVTIGIFVPLFTLKDLYGLLGRVDLQWIFLAALGYLLAIFARAIRYRWPLLHCVLEAGWLGD